MSLQEAAEARKAKLAALKKRKTLHDSGAPAANGAGAEDGEDGEPFKFRNYDPETGTLRKHARTDEHDTVEKQVEGLTDRIIAEDQLQRAQELDLTNIQPKKPNWDLKRDLERKLSKLRPKTDLAISQLIRKRLQAQKGVSEPAGNELLGALDKAGPGADDEEVGSDEE